MNNSYTPPAIEPGIQPDSIRALLDELTHLRDENARQTAELELLREGSVVDQEARRAALNVMEDAVRAEAALRASEERQRFLLRISDNLRSLDDQLTIQDVAMRLLGEHFGATRAYYFLAESIGAQWFHTIETEYRAHTEVASMVGRHAVSAFNEDLFAGLEQGTPVHVDDIRLIPGLGDAEREQYAAFDIVAFVNVPLIRGHDFVGGVAVHSSAPHLWTEGEIDLIREVAGRVWTAVERARAVELLRESEGKLANELADTQQLQQLSSRLIEENNIEALYEHILDAAMSIMRADLASIQMFSPGGESLILLAHRNFAPESAAFWQEVTISQLASCGMASALNSRVEIPDVMDEECGIGGRDLASYRLSGIRSVQSTPLVSRGGHLLGIISTHWRVAHRPAETEYRLFDVLTRQAADVVERRSAEAEIHRSEELFSALVGNAPFGVYLIGADFRLRVANAGARKVFAGINPLLGRNFADVLRSIWPEAFASQSIARFRHTLDTGESFIAPPAIERRADTNEIESYDWQLHRVTLPDGEYGVVCYFYDLSAQKQLEAAVRESETRMRTLADAVPQIIWANTGDGTANYFNKRWYEYSGLDFEESVGLGWEAIVHPDDAVRSVPIWRDALAAGEVFDTEYRLRGADGAYRWFIGRNVPMRDADNRVVGWFGTATDINELRLAAEALVIGEERFRTALQAAEMAAWDYDVVADTVLWNEQHFKLLGLPVIDDRLSPENFLRAVHPDDNQRIRDELALAVNVTGVYRAKFRIVREDNGETCWMSGYGRAISRVNGVVQRMTGVMMDITDQHESETRLMEAEERLRTLVDSALEHAIISMDSERRVTSWNPGAEEILGYSAQQIFGQSADVIFTPEARAEGVPEQEMQNALRDGRANDDRWMQRRDGSRFWANGAMLPMRRCAEEPVLGFVKILRDETAMREAQLALERSREQLLEALQENERAREEVEAASASKDRFLAMLSHELRTPLTPVLMGAYVLDQLPDLPDIVRKTVRMIQRNLKIEAQFIDDLLDVTRIGSGKLRIARERFDVHDAIRRAVEVSDGDIRAKKISLFVSLDAEHHFMVGDAARMQQVFWNLLKNAAKFTRSGGEVRVQSWTEAELLHVSVVDTGIGIEADALDRIFNAFAQADVDATRNFGGLGLGLAIAKAAVEAHGGKITASSEGRDAGATFIVTLPWEPNAESGVITN